MVRRRRRDSNRSDVEWLVTADLDGYAPRDELFADAPGSPVLTATRLDRLVSDYLRDYPRFFEPDPGVGAALATSGRTGGASPS